MEKLSFTLIVMLLTLVKLTHFAHKKTRVSVLTMNLVEATWLNQLKAKLKDMQDKMVWLCIDCFSKLWAGRALGLTSHDPQKCANCEQTRICVLMSSVKLRIKKGEKK